MQIVKYKPAALGLGTESSSKLQPLDFSPNIINRFYNMLGDLEKRHGTQGIISGGPWKGIAEYVDASGVGTLLTFDANLSPGGRGAITAGSFQGRTISVQMNEKLIIVDGISRPQYYNPALGGGASAYRQLRSVITKGITGGGTTANLLFDSDITNWKTQTNVAVNDLVEIQGASSIGGGPIYSFGYGIVTSVGTTSLDMTTIGGASTGIGGTIITSASPNMSYRVLDLVELNIIPTGNTGNNYGQKDNVGVGGSATSALAISISAQFATGPTNLSTTDIAVGDYIYNTTRAAITQVTTVSSNISVTSVAGQTAGDSLVFLKEAMPIASYAHVHYGRLHLIDARDPTKIRVSGPNDPEDFTTFSKTLSSVTIDYGTRQAQGDILLTMSTFGRYLVVGGKRAVWVTDGTNPIADVTADVIDLDPVGLFPQGAFSSLSLQNIGNEMLYIGYDGMRSFMSSFDAKNTTTNNKSEQIKTEVINALQLQAAAPEQVQLIHYPRRNWVMMKIGDVIYNYNYTPIYSNGKFNNVGTFTKFIGPLATGTYYLTRRNGDLVVATTTQAYQFDVSGIFYDASANGDHVNIPTTYTTPWHTLNEADTNSDILIKDGRYIRPVFETSAAIKYNISVVGDYSQLATDSVIVTSEVSGITNPKCPLRWRGKQAQFTITTDTSVGADIISNYTIYGNVFGRK